MYTYINKGRRLQRNSAPIRNHHYDIYYRKIDSGTQATLQQQTLNITYVTHKVLHLTSPHVRVNPDSGMRENFVLESGIFGFNIHNTAQGIRNLTNDWNPQSSSTEKYWNPVPRIRNPQGGIQNPRMSWIFFHGALLHHDTWSKTQWALKCYIGVKLYK